MSPEELGRVIRAERRQQKLRQGELAALSGVGNRFLSDLENGKPTVELGRAMQVLNMLGLTMTVRAREWRDLE
ncbi:MAG: helix-turn-helix transcriptional regulator [Proteobacteria bacterium]|jgi:HTH-type transcriptional regulator/antitoxin HipB|nr:helix-turn-helix transcriptional regulator [Pseudomonadota bacterium]